jgi:hypothetical protein
VIFTTESQTLHGRSALAYVITPRTCQPIRGVKNSVMDMLGRKKIRGRATVLLVSTRIQGTKPMKSTQTYQKSAHRRSQLDLDCIFSPSVFLGQIYISFILKRFNVCILPFGIFRL